MARYKQSHPTRKTSATHAQGRFKAMHRAGNIRTTAAIFPFHQKNYKSYILKKPGDRPKHYALHVAKRMHARSKK